MSEQPPACLYCGSTANEVPLINLKYQGNDYWICPQHLPILIHEPGKLEGKLPGAEKLQGSGH